MIFNFSSHDLHQELIFKHKANHTYGTATTISIHITLTQTAVIYYYTCIYVVHNNVVKLYHYYLGWGEGLVTIMYSTVQYMTMYISV